MINEGGEIQEYAYDPWGARRNPTNWNEKDSRTSWILNRGYTGHEHIDQFGIINMNGRVYDPLTAQFFSPDPVLQAPGNWTNYNRYTYCMNNPFKYTDPSGYIMVNDEEGNYHFDAGSGAYQSRFDERGSIYLEGQRMAGSIGGESVGGDWIENSLKGTGFVQGAASTHSFILLTKHYYANYAAGNVSEIYIFSIIPFPFTVTIPIDGSCSRYFRNFETKTSKLREAKKSSSPHKSLSSFSRG